MALQLTWTDPNSDAQASAAYARVIAINVDALAQTIDLVIGLYATVAARTAGAVPFSIFHAHPAYATFLGAPIDVRAASYTYLKTLPEFNGSTDV